MVPWTDAFSLRVLTAPDTGSLTPKGTLLPRSIVSYTKNVAHGLPRDPYWTGCTLHHLIEGHKAGWHDHLRYFTPSLSLDDITGDCSDKDNDLDRDALESLVLIWAKQAGLVVQRTVDGREEEQLALPDERPVAADRMVSSGDFSIAVPNQVILNPGAYVDKDPAGLITYTENGRMRQKQLVTFKTTPEFDKVVKTFGQTVWRVKQVINEYRLGIFNGQQTDKLGNRDYVHKLVEDMLARSATHRIVKPASARLSIKEPINN